MTPTEPQPERQRLLFLDWFRGAAAVIMLQGHTFHSFTKAGERQHPAYVLSQFTGGLPPAVFLFLTGVTFAFLMDKGERKGATRQQRIQAALRRAGFITMLAVLFRLQLWVFAGGQSPASDLLKVDVLNCMAVSLAVLTPLTLLRTHDRIRWSAACGLAIAFLAPVLSQWPADTGPWLLRAYLVPSHENFPLFPWASFVAFGITTGSVLRAAQATALNRTMEWSALLGFGLLLAGQYFSNLPYSLYAHSDFWLDSPCLTLVKTGLLLLGTSAAFVWSEHTQGQASWVRVLGSSSLFVYWVHVEVVYGRWFGKWKGALTVGQCAAISVLLIVVMVLLSLGWRRRKEVWEWVQAAARVKRSFSQSART